MTASESSAAHLHGLILAMFIFLISSTALTLIVFIVMYFCNIRQPVRVVPIKNRRVTLMHSPIAGLDSTEDFGWHYGPTASVI